ncbi:type III PLP-dependent enzyme [Palleronia sp. KMU-117]|uniref:type III PLP-dependent enzyme n=1 Tax=Palleronia sp. KMU-117 TaxID=3434108 RepID=UPI003D732E9F
MSRQPALWPSPAEALRAETPDQPLLCFSPAVLQATFRRFRDGFPGLVTYAVKANDARMVIENLVAAGMTAFDVASPDEMRRVRDVLPGAVLHYNNPVRSRAEIAEAVAIGVASCSVDCETELAKLAQGGLPRGTEVSARLRLPVKGGAYDFGAKFGADPAACADLLRAIVAAGYSPAITFHPGTQCADPEAWRAYIEAAAAVARDAGVRIGRLNVGGGFAARRVGAGPDIKAAFATIADATRRAFGPDAPALVCEPGRAMVADCMTLATRVKAVRRDGTVFLNDGIYGGLAEMPVMGMTDRLSIVDAQGRPRQGPLRPRIVFGPTCDSLDRLPGEVPLPADIVEGDYLLVHGMGAYSTATLTRFNGYGDLRVVTVEQAG